MNFSLLRFLHKIRGLAWFLPGFLLWAAFPPMAEASDVLFALAPLLWLTRQGHRRESVQRCFQSGLFYWMATLSWMPAIVKNGGPWPLVVLGWGLLAAYCALYFALYGYLSATYWRWCGDKAMRRLLGVLLVEPILWCGLELVRANLFTGFAWNPVGLVLANVSFGRPAALGGVYLLSAVVVLVNGTLAGIAERFIASFRRSPLNRARSLETLFAFSLVFLVYAVAPDTPERTADDAAIRVALIQRNFPCCFKEKAENPVRAYGRLFAQVGELKPDLVVLSESAMAEFGPLDQQGGYRFAQWALRQTGARALLGGGNRFGDGLTYNSAALYTTNGLAVYDKVHLVPFGEYIPFDKTFPLLQRLAPVGSCTPGERTLLTFEGIPIGVGICYEDTDAAHVRALAKDGARLLVFITNDSWFSHSDEAHQHAWHATARAIETGLPVVRVGNSGVTGVISPEGCVRWLIDAEGAPLVDHAATLFDRVRPSSHPPTPYVRFGDLPLAILFALTLCATLALLIAERRREGRSCWPLCARGAGTQPRQPPR